MDIPETQDFISVDEYIRGEQVKPLQLTTN